ncbi:Gp49 family protein [Gluconobacter kondonii]|uniref:Gp49 family protein n=1 Tax=Gluconobacter kondonii TaxID=941463 RepID=UPI002011AE7B|nr:Gp49 family protein [Gluconobacter kondonii]
MSNEQALENEIQAKGLNAPRLTPSLIDGKIVDEQYHVFPGTTLTVCVLHLENGFTVTGESACASPENFDEEIGRKIARGNAREKIWQLEGYVLRGKVHLLDRARPLGGRIAEIGGKTYLGQKVIHAVPMHRQAYIDLRGWSLPADEDGADEGFLVQYADQDQENVPGFTGYISWSPKDVFERAYECLVE